jgi:hypothetical protein
MVFIELMMFDAYRFSCNGIKILEILFQYQKYSNDNDHKIMELIRQGHRIFNQQMIIM